MSKYTRSTNLAAYIACGVAVGSAVGTAAAMMISAKKKKPVGIREKAISAADTMGTVMQNIANMVR